MSHVIVPEGYRSALSLYETQAAIDLIKQTFQNDLSHALNLKRVSAPLFVDGSSGLNDDLNGFERPVSFDMLETGEEAQVVHSLAKWKRYALARYHFPVGEGLYTDMNAIRRDEAVLDNLHSVYVDQWDWEKVIRPEDRNLDYLKDVVTKIVGALADTKDQVNAEFPQLKRTIDRQVTFITSQELEDLYPDLTPNEREDAFVKEHPTTFIMQIGDVLKSGQKHDGRAPDYDDWQLNGDLLLWNDILGCAEEISSMGIRVDADSLLSQLKKAGCEERAELPFHKSILDGTYPLCIGGGIGQSRVCLYMLEKAHVGEVQVSIWPEDMYMKCAEYGIYLLK
jgi:aspartate--ammonia ligase